MCNARLYLRGFEMNTTASTYLTLIAAVLVVTGCGGGQEVSGEPEVKGGEVVEVSKSDWKDIVRDGKVFSKEHLAFVRMKIFMSLELRKNIFEINGKTESSMGIPVQPGINLSAFDNLDSLPTGVGVTAAEVERLYGKPTRKSEKSFGTYKSYYGDAGIIFHAKTKEVIGIEMPTMKVSEEFLEIVNPILVGVPLELIFD